MSQLDVSNVNPQPQIDNEIIIQKKDDFDAIIDGGLKKIYEKETGLDKMEQLQLKPAGQAAPKPESTMHKVGRYLAGIFGGILLGVGIGAATVATLGSFGIAVGVAAAVGGVTGASILAGASGATGIGLIVTSALMKPKNPEALLPQAKSDRKGIVINERPELNSGLKPLKFGEGEIGTVKETLKGKHGTGNADYKITDESKQIMVNLLDSFEKNDVTGKASIDGEKFNGEEICDFVKDALEQFGIKNDFEANEKNKLIVRLAIDKFFEASSDKMSPYDGEKLNLLNDKDFKSRLAVFCAREKMGLEGLNFKLLDIFTEALRMESVDVPDGVKVVSMQDQPKEPVKFAKGEEDNILKSLKEVDRNFPGMAYAPKKAMENVCDGFSMNEKGEVTNIDGESVCAFVNDTLQGNIIYNSNLTQKNVLIVRHAITKFFNENSEKFPGVLKSLNTPEGQKQCADILQKKMDLENDEETRNQLAIFKAAISQSDLSRIDPDENLLLLQSQVIKLALRRFLWKIWLFDVFCGIRFNRSGGDREWASTKARQRSPHSSSSHSVCFLDAQN